MVKILSFDVGIKNLAYCILDFKDDSEINIIDWNIIDLSTIFLKDNLYCSVTKRGVKCKNIAFNFVNVDLNSRLGFCKNKICQSVLNSNYKKKIKKYKKIKIKDISLFNLGKELIEQLKTNFQSLDVNLVIIENQPVLKNPTMKSIQMILYSYFLINHNVNIVLFNAIKKLDIYDGPKLNVSYDSKTYNGRKKLSIEYTLYFLKKYNEVSKLNYFKNNSKKDDLSDCYLQCLTYYNKNKTKLLNA